MKVAVTATPSPDICYGPLAVGQFFLNPYSTVSSPSFFRIYGKLSADVYLCEKWRMREDHGDFSFTSSLQDRGWQISLANLQTEHRMSAHQARLHAEKALRSYDEAYRARYNPEGGPIPIVRCNCGAGDRAPRTMHTVLCFFRDGI